MSTWPGDLVGPIAFAMAVWTGGATIVLAWRWRWDVTTIAAAIPVGVLGIALTAVVQSVRSFDYGWPAVLAGWAVLCVVGLVLHGIVAAITRVTGYAGRVLTAEGQPAVTTRAGRVGGRRKEAGRFAGVLAASIVLGFLVMWAAGGGSWEIVSQTWDAMFDANAVRHVYDTGVVAPTRISDFAYPQPVGGYYPSGFHAMGSLVMALTGRDAVVGTNIVAGLMAGGLWPSVVVLAARFVFESTLRSSLCALVLAWGFWGLPWGPLSWGVLWATALAGMYAPLVFAGLAGVMKVTRVARPLIPSLALGMLGTGVVAVFHPRMTVPVLALAIGLWVWWCLGIAWRGMRENPSRISTSVVALTGVLVPLSAIAFLVLRVGRGDSTYAARGWPVEYGLPLELAQYVVNGQAHSVPQLASGALLLVGLWRTLRVPPHRWMAVFFLGAVTLDILTAVLRDVDAYDGLARFWYDDRYRTVILTPFPAILLALVGADHVLDRLMGRSTGRRRPDSGRWIVPERRLLGAGAVIVVVWGAVAGLSSLRSSYIDAATHPQESVVSPAEVDFFRQIADVVPPGERILNNANDGSALMYAYTGRMPVFLVAGVRASTEYGETLWDDLTELRPELMCHLAAHDGIRWVYNGGPAYRKGIIAAQEAPGMQVPPGFWATRPVLLEDGRTLFQLTGCPP